jgi:glycosyltransferase involved in cell wall biosynthesis
MDTIGHITTHYWPPTGGQEIYVRNLIRCLGSYTHEVFQLRHDPENPPEDARVKVKFIESLPFFPPYLKMLAGLARRRISLSKCQALIVNYPEYFRPIAWHPRTIVLSHGATWGNLVERKRDVKIAMSRYALARCAAYVFNDTFAMREVGLQVEPGTRLFEWITEKAVFIPNCVDTVKFSRTGGLSWLKKLNSLCVPRNLNYGRGIDLAIEALQVLKGKGHDLCLVVVGDSNIGDIAYRRQLFRLIGEKKLVGRVLFLGSVENEAMPDIYSSCLLTLIPTRWREGTSLSALESMACGTPVVATNVEGLLDLPAVHCQADPNSIAHAVEKTLDAAEHHATEQQSTVREKFAFDRWETAWNDVVERVLGRIPV